MRKHTTTHQGTPRWQQLGTRLGLTARPETFGERFANSAAVWLALMAYWAVSDRIIAIFPPSGRQLPPVGGLIILSVTLVGLLTIWCLHRSRFPAAWDVSIPARRRLLFPLLRG